MIEAAAELHAHECGASTPSDRNYERWLVQAAKALGVLHLDEDEAVMGYSIDSAFDAWTSGITPEDYAKGIRGPSWKRSAA
jgi:hypothetical protein